MVAAALSATRRNARVSGTASNSRSTLALEPGRRWEEVVLAGDLQAVSGEEEDAEPAAIEPVSEFADALVHGATVEVDAENDLDAGALQDLGDRRASSAGLRRGEAWR